MSGIKTCDREMIHDLICRFFLAFDTRDWALMAATLSHEIFVDYASSGREEPTTMCASDFVARRKGAVDALSKHHSFSNLLPTLEEGKLTARCNYTILRFPSNLPMMVTTFITPVVPTNSSLTELTTVGPSHQLNSDS